MLVALDEQQKLFQLQMTLSKTQIQQLKQETKFFCPQCHELLVLKVGQIKIPHFAHQKNSLCESLFSEGESYSHLTGKQQLFTFFLKRNLQPVLEPYLRDIKQRPDILITKGNKQFAIEFQCSKLSSEIYLQRTTGYKDVAITSVWIPQTPHARFKNRGLTKLSISHTLAQYLHRYNNQTYLLTYDVHSETFYYVSNLLPLHGRQYLGVVQVVPLMQQTFPFLIPKILSKSLFHSMIARFRTYRDSYIHSRLLLSRKGVRDPFLRAVYELKLTLATVPSFIGIPVKFAEYIDVFCVEWQLQFMYFLCCHKLTPQTMNKQAIPYFLQWARIETHEHAIQAVARYLVILKQLNIENIHNIVQWQQLIDLLYDELVAIG